MTNQKIRVWWISNPPKEAERYHVESVEEAIKVIGILATHDLALGDLIDCNASGLEAYDETDKEWNEYHDEEDRDIDEIMDEMEVEKK